MIKEEEFVHDPRRAGSIHRYHAQTHIVTQTVAEHTWQLMRIATTIWPDIPRHVMLYIQYHDVAEGMTGDLPYTTKLRDPEIKERMDIMEVGALKRMRQLWDLPEVPKITDEEKRFVKACEYLEFAEYSFVEWNLGNSYIQVVLDRVMPLIRATKLQDTYLNTRYHLYVKQRLSYEINIGEKKCPV